MRSANGTRTTNTISTAAIALSRRSRSSMRCEMNDCSSPSPSSRSVPLMIRIGRWRRAAGFAHGGLDVGTRIDFRRRFAQVAFELLGGQLALDFLLHVVPAGACAPQQ